MKVLKDGVQGILSVDAEEAIEALKRAAAHIDPLVEVVALLTRLGISLSVARDFYANRQDLRAQMTPEAQAITRAAFEHIQFYFGESDDNSKPN